jgi:hypothetical protein
MPYAAAVNAAPTVPECRIARPALAPRLMPDTTSSGAGPKVSRVASTTMYAGEAATPYAGMSPKSLRVIATRPSSVYALSAALTPLASSEGAATTTSNPSSAWASVRIPGEWIPSSLVTSTRRFMTAS